MLCRALIAAVAVTYLICVLLLSGVQKEDLDVGVLTKLQRHNVNIVNMNNEELLRMCTNEHKNKINNNGKTSESQLRGVKIINTISNFKTNNGSENLKKLYNITDNNSYYFGTVPKSKHDLQENATQALVKNKDNNKLNLYNDRQTEVESILKYLLDVKTNKAATRPDNNKELENKISITADSLQNSTEEDNLNKLITNFILRRKNTILTPSTQKTININDVFEKLNSLRMQDMGQNYNSNADFGRSFVYSPIRQNVQKSPTEIGEESGTMRGDSEILNRKNTSDILLLLDPDANIMRNFNDKTEHRLSRNLNLNNFKRYETVGTTRPTNVEAQFEISRNMIKEIAESVKEIVLRDLRKELHKTTYSVVSSTSTTTTIKSTTRMGSSTKRESVTQENTKNQESVMNKFLELFEEIKSLRQNTIVLTNNNEKELEVFSQVTTPHRIPNLIQPSLPLYANQAHGLNQGNNFNFAPQLHKHKSNGTIIKVKTKNLNKGLLPITVQTNNIEIPPLGISLDSPQNLINQNIIVITKAPHRIISSINNDNANVSPIKNRNRKGSQYIDTNKYLKEYKSKQVNSRLPKEIHTYPSHHFRSSNKDNVIRLTLNNNEQSNYNADYYEKINIGKYYPHLNSEEIKHQEIPRFHEKLEKVERYLDYPEQEKYVDYPERYVDNPNQNNADKNDCCNKKFSQAMVDCCDRKIASRQQISINNNIKKKSYDETHFKKFLQSQQKVTDMLERILGDKGNVHSVETA